MICSGLPTTTLKEVIGGGWDGSGEHKTGVIGGGLDGRGEHASSGGRGGRCFFVSWCASPALHWPTALAQCDGTQRFLGAGGCMVVPDPLLGRRCGGLLATRMRAAAPSAFTSTEDSIP